jgi:dolichol kinase
MHDLDRRWVLHADHFYTATHLHVALHSPHPAMSHSLALFMCRVSCSGMVAICLMCGGDGLADVVGRRWGGSNRLPYNPSKSLIGSVAMLLGGTAMAAG